jgi:acetylornithine deacetylase/succinyl-diaminopimelate desuccinylase-like protein
LIAPTAMIFAPSKDGISHSPKEYTNFEMLEKTTNVMLNTILKIDKVRLD